MVSTSSGIFVFLLLANLPRSASKGCFVGTVEVTLANGGRKQLQHVQVGDTLTSFDEATGKTAVSTVMAVPKYRRSYTELIHIVLPSASIHATHDHPFWSRGRAALVSANPNQTMSEYSLEANAFSNDEELENEQQEGVGVSGIFKAPARSLSASSLRGNADDVEVMTLCMHPHHWYYVQGVRVHNKGCFLPSTPVTLADGTKKELRQVAVGESVSSWDEVLGRPMNSTVMAVPTFQRRTSELVEVSLPSAFIHVTHDHPFWSKGRNSLVSLHPNQTREEYGLEAQHMMMGEELDGEGSEQYVQVSGIRRLLDIHASVPAHADRAVDVMTLCLQPYHWYYVQGVRVHNKGCFIPSTAVTLADGTRKELRDVAIGESVSSWDEMLGRPVNSTVMATPTFQRKKSELVEVSLPSASIHVTHDHPFWSKGRNSLVSSHPDQTREDYALEVQLMTTGEKLEGEDSQQQVPVSRIRRLMDTAQPDNDTDVEVMTLCLEPYHWYYVHGVRVHNKGGGGCFAPWTPVLMSDYTQKPISEVKERDTVISWDESRGQTSVATVLGVAQFQPADLIEISLNSSTAAEIEDSARRHLRSAPVGAAWSAPKLVLTRDHPIYSARAESVVSMNPNRTSQLYGIMADQMHDDELLRHHLGHNVYAQVRDWNGSLDVVMTLQLDRHHWFHVHGVRVHNKGGGGGGGGGAGMFRSTSTVRHSRSTYVGFWPGFIVLNAGNRRRYGTYHREQDNDCKLKQPESVVTQACWDSGLGDVWSSDQSKCYQCLDCKSESCIRNIPKCDTFTDEAYDYCETEEDEGVNTVAIVIIVIIFCGCPLCCGLVFCVYMASNQAKERNTQSQAINNRTQVRMMMQTCNDNNLGPQLKFNGTYTENGETKATSYTFNIDGSGHVTGEAIDDDGRASVQGKLNWKAGYTEGQIAWLEQPSHAKIEAAGTIQVSQNGSEVTLILRADYDSSYQATRGHLYLSCVDSGYTPPPMAQATVIDAIPGVVVGQPMGKAGEQTETKPFVEDHMEGHP